MGRAKSSLNVLHGRTRLRVTEYGEDKLWVLVTAVKAKAALASSKPSKSKPGVKRSSATKAVNGKGKGPMFPMAAKGATKSAATSAVVQRPATIGKARRAVRDVDRAQVLRVLQAPPRRVKLQLLSYKTHTIASGVVATRPAKSTARSLSLRRHAPTMYVSTKRQTRQLVSHSVM